MIFRLRIVKFRMICYHDAEQLGHVETFHYGRTPLKDMHAEPISYVIAQIKELDSCWQDTIRKCKNILADLVSIFRFRGWVVVLDLQHSLTKSIQNTGVLEESFGEIDRKIARKLYKYAQTWEQLRQVHTQQLEALQDIVRDGQTGIWFNPNRNLNVVDQPELEESQDFKDMAALLTSLEIIGTKIDLELVQETSALISRVKPPHLVPPLPSQAYPIVSRPTA